MPKTAQGFCCFADDSMTTDSYRGWSRKNDSNVLASPFKLSMLVRTYAARPTPLSAALTAAVKSRWKNGVSVDTSGAYPMGEESISESDFLKSPDSRSLALSTPNRGEADGSLAYGSTAAISC